MKCLGLPGATAEIITGSIGKFKRSLECAGLLWCRKEFNLSNQLHSTIVSRDQKIVKHGKRRNFMIYLDAQEIVEAVEKGELDKAHLVIGWKADEWGYDVVVTDTDEMSAIYRYSASNSPWDSKQWVGVEHGVGEARLREWAQETAAEIADEIGLPQSVVFEEED